MHHISAAHDDHASALRICRRIQAAMGAVIAVVHIHGVILDENEAVLRARGDIGPVGAAVAAVDRFDHRVTAKPIKDVPMVIRLDHDVAGIGVDELPVPVGTHARRVCDGLEAGRIQIDLQIGFVTFRRGRAELREVVALPVSRSIRRK